MEIPLFFGSNGHKLFGVLHKPEPNKGNEHNKQLLGIVFCHSFAEEKLISHRVMVNLARALADDGHYVLRFDYMGHGDSEGNFEDATLETRLSDIKRAIYFIRKTVTFEKVALVGLRLGATLGALYAEIDKYIDCLILIAPIIKGESYIRECLRSNLTTQMTTYHKITKTREQLITTIMDGDTVNIDGYLLTKKLYLEMSKIDLLQDVKRYSNNVAILQLSKKENQILPNSIKELYSIYSQKGNYTRIYNVNDNLFWAETKIYHPMAKNTYKTVLKFLNDVYQMGI